jgi:hypothetical protein
MKGWTFYRDDDGNWQSDPPAPRIPRRGQVIPSGNGARLIRKGQGAVLTADTGISEHGPRSATGDA